MKIKSLLNYVTNEYRNITSVPRYKANVNSSHLHSNASSSISRRKFPGTCDQVTPTQLLLALFKHSYRVQ